MTARKTHACILPSVVKWWGNQCMYFEENIAKGTTDVRVQSFYRTSFFRTYHKVLHKSWSNFMRRIFKIANKHQHLNETSSSKSWTDWASESWLRSNLITSAKHRQQNMYRQNLSFKICCGRVSRWMAQGGTGAAEEAGVSSSQAHRPGGGGDDKSPADQSIGSAAEGPLRPLAQQDSKLSHTSNRWNPIVCTLDSQFAMMCSKQSTSHFC